LERGEEEDGREEVEKEGKGGDREEDLEGGEVDGEG
jgi:hypothetical protein